MAFLRHTPLRSFESVGAGSTAYSVLYKGRLTHAIGLEIGDNGASSNGLDLTQQANVNTMVDAIVGQVRVMVDSYPARTFKLSELNQLNSVNGAAYAASVSGAAGNAACRAHLTIMFADIFRNNQVEDRKNAWNLSKSTPDVKIEVDINNGIVNPVVYATHEWEPADEGRGLGAVCKWIRGTIPTLSAQNDYDLLRLMGGDWLQSMHFFPTVEAVPKFLQSLRINAGGLGNIIENITYLENQVKLLKRQMVPDTAAVPRWDWVLDYTDRLDDALQTSMLTALQAYFTFNGSAAGAMPYIIQKTGTIEGVK